MDVRSWDFVQNGTAVDIAMCAQSLASASSSRPALTHLALSR
jgi:hypothetical protein